MPQGNEGIEEVQELEEEHEEEYEGEEEEDEEDYAEDARETVARVLAEQREAEEQEEGEPEEDASGEEVEQPAEAAPQTDQPQQQQQEEKAVDPYEDVLSRDIEPPARFTAERKEQFNKLPKWAKVAVNDAVKDTEAHMTRTQQQYTSAIKESERMVEAVRPYLLSNPDLQKAGFTESTLVSGLIGSHQRLRNPETRFEEFVQIGKNIGVDPELLEEIQRYSGGEAGNAAEALNHPQFKQLQEEHNQLKSYFESQRQQAESQAAEAVTSQFREVQMETNPDGSYRFPELHDNGFIDRLKPVVSGLVEADPQLSYGEALKRAYQSVTGKGYLPQQQQTALPASNGAGHQPQRAASAASISVRGKTAPTSNNVQQDVPAEALANARASAAWALSQLKRG